MGKNEFKKEDWLLQSLEASLETSFNTSLHHENERELILPTAKEAS